ncbi:Baculoviral IAP repeat-containing protein 3 [Mizuhopecten yessoensis]|uniref:Baculoviral IAP repeat-containing protein 3 n=1 Tax=Mizuhopecten yessoensis TaxID=6573 RepID=A0A210QDQ2_MIZYE|nr:Baculoviral IAP repeat-containing protein 3 [Mizuhopecten yessoensis]
MSTLACTAKGPIKDLNFIRRLWLSIFYKTLNNKGRSTVIKYPDFESREERLKSFPSSWPIDMVPKAEELADAGLFFCGYPHLAKCFMCGYLLMNWRRDDVPWQAHAAINSRCPFIQKRRAEEEINDAIASYTESRYTANMEYEATEARRKTFEWLDSEQLTKCTDVVCDVADLVEAGFYYTGTCDMFNCYACAVTLTCITSRIMATHAKIPPKCPHVLKKRGKEYVKDVDV